MKFRVLALVLCLCLLCGCGDQFRPAVITTGGGDEDAPPQEEPEARESKDAEPEPVNLFETIPGTYLFCSGAGGWGTELTLEADGSFTGVFHDSDMGVADPEKYPQGTRYLCAFSGKFTQPAQVDETTWSMEIETLELEHPDDGTEEYADGVRYIYSGPYGLEDAEEIRIYLPDTPAEGLLEDVLWAVRGPYDWKPTEEGTLGLTVLYNVSQAHGFVQYPLEGAD